MSSKRTGSKPLPANAFDEAFLAAVDRIDEPVTAAEAETSGAWEAQPMPQGGWGVFRRGQSPDRGDVPAATFRRRERALLAAAVLPGTGRDPLLRLHLEPDPDGFALESRAGEVEGHLRLFDESLRDALHVAECLLRSPQALSRLLEAAGGIALREAGRILWDAEGIERP